MKSEHTRDVVGSVVNFIRRKQREKQHSIWKYCSSLSKGELAEAVKRWLWEALKESLERRRIDFVKAPDLKALKYYIFRITKARAINELYLDVKGISCKEVKMYAFAVGLIEKIVAEKGELLDTELEKEVSQKTGYGDEYCHYLVGLYKKGIRRELTLKDELPMKKEGRWREDPKLARHTTEEETDSVNEKSDSDKEEIGKN